MFYQSAFERSAAPSGWYWRPAACARLKWTLIITNRARRAKRDDA
jgi:hypothetical protein